MTFDTDALNESYPARVTLEIVNAAATTMLILIQDDGVTQERVLALIDDMRKMSTMTNSGFLANPSDADAVQHFLTVMRDTIEFAPRPPSPWTHLP